MRASLRLLLTASALSAVLAIAAPAGRANPFDIYGFNPRAQAMGGAMTAGVDDYTAAYYNPACLTLEKKVNFGGGLILTVPALFVDRGNPDSEHATSLPSNHFGITLGWRYPLGGVFEEKLALGIGVHLPVTRVTRVQGVDPQRPQFYMYQNLQDKLLIITSLAYEPLPYLSIGVGAAILSDLVGETVLELDVINSSYQRRDIAVELIPTASLIAGINARLMPGLDIGLSYRGESSLSFQLPIKVSEGDAFKIDIDVSQTVLWSPHQIAFGLSYALPNPRLRISADLTVALWSRAPDPSPRLSVDIGGALLDGLGLGGAMDLSVDSSLIELSFRDTVTPRLGVEWHALQWLKVRAGYFFRPTPAPRQTGVTAYLDNDAHVVALGAGFVFFDPLDVRPTPIELDISIQGTFLTRRTVYRDDPHDPVGSLSHGGSIWNFSLALSHRY